MNPTTFFSLVLATFLVASGFESRESSAVGVGDSGGMFEGQGWVNTNQSSAIRATPTPGMAQGSSFRVQPSVQGTPIPNITRPVVPNSVPPAGVPRVQPGTPPPGGVLPPNTNGPATSTGAGAMTGTATGAATGAGTGAGVGTGASR